MSIKINDNIFLTKTQFYEYIPKYRLENVIQYGIFNNNPFPVNDMWYDRCIERNLRCPMDFIELYYNNNKDDIVEVRYNKFDGPWGRLYPDLSTSVLKAPVRRTLLNGYYYDFDIKSTYLAILKNVCIKNGIRCDVLRYVEENKDDIAKDLVEYYGLSKERQGREIAKDLIYINIYNGDENDVKKVMEKYELKKEFPKLLKDFKEDMEKIKEELIKRNPELYAYVKNNFKNVKGRTFYESDSMYGRNSLNGYFISLYLQEIETQIVNKILEWIYNNTDVMKFRGRNGFMMYEYDGFHLLRENVDREFGDSKNFVKILEKKTQELTGMDLKWDSKLLNDDLIDFKGYMDIDRELLIYGIGILVIILVIYLNNNF